MRTLEKREQIKEIDKRENMKGFYLSLHLFFGEVNYDSTKH